MRKFLLSLLALSFFIAGNKAIAQKGAYWLTATAGSYTELSGATDVAGTLPWDSAKNFIIPIGFTFVVETSVTSNIYLNRVNSFCVDTFKHPILHGFQLLNAALTDRGSGSSASPISYQLSGTPGSQILKLQLKNAGFIQELINHSTLNDYVNLQLWLYEGSNVVEIHFGPSHLTYPDLYFGFSGNSPAIGYVRRKNLTGDGTMYPATGLASSPSDIGLTDSVVFQSFGIFYNGSSLLGYPAPGTIFKFGPLKAGVNNVNVKDANIYPTVCKSYITVDYISAEPTTFEVISVRGIPTTLKGTLQNGTSRIDLSKIAAGNYLLRLQNSTGKFVQKFVKL